MLLFWLVRYASSILGLRKIGLAVFGTVAAVRFEHSDVGGAVHSVYLGLVGCIVCFGRWERARERSERASVGCSCTFSRILEQAVLANLARSRA